MGSRQSMCLIVLLLAALLLGPAVVRTRRKRGQPPLRAAALQERLLDAPHDIAGSRAPFPDGRSPLHGPLFR